MCLHQQRCPTFLGVKCTYLSEEGGCSALVAGVASILHQADSNRRIRHGVADLTHHAHEPSGLGKLLG